MNIIHTQFIQNILLYNIHDKKCNQNAFKKTLSNSI